MAPAKTEGQRLLLKPRQAAQACEASERWLWQHSQPRGPIPCVRIGGLVRYCPEALKRYFASQQEGGE